VGSTRPWTVSCEALLIRVAAERLSRCSLLHVSALKSCGASTKPTSTMRAGSSLNRGCLCPGSETAAEGAGAGEGTKAGGSGEGIEAGTREGIEAGAGEGTEVAGAAAGGASGA